LPPLDLTILPSPDLLQVEGEDPGHEEEVFFSFCFLLEPEGRSHVPPFTIFFGNGIMSQAVHLLIGIPSFRTHLPIPARDGGSVEKDSYLHFLLSFVFCTLFGVLFMRLTPRSTPLPFCSFNSPLASSRWFFHSWPPLLLLFPASYLPEVRNFAPHLSVLEGIPVKSSLDE